MIRQKFKIWNQRKIRKMMITNGKSTLIRIGSSTIHMMKVLECTMNAYVA